MVRVKRGTTHVKKRERLLKHAKGYRWRRKSTIRAARQALMKAWSYAYRDRKARKRDFRALWNIKINAGVREHGMKYNIFIHNLLKASIQLDRKILAQLAEFHPDIFKQIVERVK